MWFFKPQWIYFFFVFLIFLYFIYLCHSSLNRAIGTRLNILKSYRDNICLKPRETSSFSYIDEPRLKRCFFFFFSLEQTGLACGLWGRERLVLTCCSWSAVKRIYVFECILISLNIFASDGTIRLMPPYTLLQAYTKYSSCN